MQPSCQVNAIQYAFIWRSVLSDSIVHWLLRKISIVLVRRQPKIMEYAVHPLDLT